MQRARAVAALTPDGVALENRRLVAVQRPGHGAQLVGVAEQALGLDDALEVRVRVELPVAGGDVPATLLGEPRDRRLEQETIALDQEGGAARPRAESEADLGLDLGEHASRRVAARRLVEHAPVAALDRVLHALRLERQSRSGGGRRAFARAADRRERSTHRVRAVGKGDLPVASGAGRVSDIRDPRARVLERRVGVHVANAKGAARRLRARSRRPPAARSRGPRRLPITSNATTAKAALRRRTERGEGEGMGSFTAHSRGHSGWAFAAATYDRHYSVRKQSKPNDAGK